MSTKWQTMGILVSASDKQSWRDVVCHLSKKEKIMTEDSSSAKGVNEYLFCILPSPLTQG